MSRIENCGFHICPDGMSCCEKCDKKGNLYPTGQCVNQDEVDATCPLDDCRNETKRKNHLDFDLLKIGRRKKAQSNDGKPKPELL